MRMNLEQINSFFFFIFTEKCVIIGTCEKRGTMNLIEKVESAISNPDWDLYTKARYLYLKSCEYFTYDYRYYYGDINLTRELLNKEIDLENITDNKVICGSWANQVYIPLLELIGINGEIVGTYTGHQYVKFLIDGKEVLADACGVSDLAHVKFHNNTRGFYPNHKHYDYDQIPKIDQNIGYLDTEYFITRLNKRISTLEEQFQNNGNPQDLFYQDEFLISKLYEIKEMLESFSNLKEFTDCQFFIDYVLGKMLTNFEKDKIYKFDLYNPYLPDWDFKRLYQVDLTNDILYFLLEKIENGYMFYEIGENTAKTYKLNSRYCQIK